MSERLRPQLYGIFGHPVGHSLSPVMHNAAFRHLEIEACYVPFDVADIEAGVQAVRTLDIRGVSITVPHKISIMPYLDQIDDAAAKIGAVNTVVNRDGVLTGTNTDGIGAVRALSEKGPIQRMRVAVVGAGGAARAIGFGVQSAGGQVTIFNRTVDRGRKLAEDLGCEFVPLSDIMQADTDIVVNATTVGMHPNSEKSPLPFEFLKPGMIVMDAVYSPLKTRLLEDAEARGCTQINGLHMLIYQGAAQFELWTGEKAPSDLMLRAAEERRKPGR